MTGKLAGLSASSWTFASSIPSRSDGGAVKMLTRAIKKFVFALVALLVILALLDLAAGMREAAQFLKRDSSLQQGWPGRGYRLRPGYTGTAASTQVVIN